MLSVSLAEGSKVSKVPRHRSGYVPSFVPNAKKFTEDKLAKQAELQEYSAEEEQEEEIIEQEITKSNKQVESSESEDDDIAPTRTIIQPKLLDVDDDDKVVGLSDSDDEDDNMRRKILSRIKDEESDNEDVAKSSEASAVKGNNAESSEESSEYESDSSEEEAFSLVARVPVFVKKIHRKTIEEQEELEKQEEIEEIKMKEERINETRDYVKESVLKTEVEENKDDLSDEQGDPHEEYQKWTAREKARLIRDKNERNHGVEKITDESERVNATKEKKKMKFLQKYYHKGAFYQDEDILKRDFSEATGDDKLNKTLLPEVMQVKNFGRSGRTKYTHLVDQDTTNKEAWGFGLKRKSETSPEGSQPYKKYKQL